MGFSELAYAAIVQLHTLRLHFASQDVAEPWRPNASKTPSELTVSICQATELR